MLPDIPLYKQTMKKEFNLKGDKRAFFKLYIQLLSIQNPISTLRKQDRDVLATVMYNHAVIASEYKDADNPKKWRALFSYENRLKMIDECNMAEAGFANCLTSLRKNKLLDADNRLHTVLRVYPDKANSVVFNINSKEETGE